MALTREQGFAQLLAKGFMHWSQALAMQGRGEEGITQLRQGQAARRAVGNELGRLFSLACLAEAYGTGG